MARDEADAVRGDPRVRRFVREYLPRLRRRFRPELVLLFGSRARGEALDQSDLDLLVVSERFRGVSFLDRAAGVLAALEAPFAVEVLCYTPEEFRARRRGLSIVAQAVAEGEVLWQADPGRAGGAP